MTASHVEHRRVGPPGCGKTTWLARQCVHAADKYGSDAVGVCSLTKAAAAEVAGRKTNIKPELVGTLHSHAYRALKHPDIAETSAGIKQWNEYVGVASWRLPPSIAANPEGDTSDGAVLDTEGAELLSAMNILRARQLDESHWPPAVQSFSAKWEAFKSAHGLMDFTDLIEQALERVDAMTGQPSVIMVDEAQDMSALEMALIRKWGAECEQLVIIGDPDQALYEWRGACPDVVFGHDRDRVEVLSQSYRVPQAILERALAWIEQMPDRLPIAYEARRVDPDDPDSPTAAGEVRDRSYTWGDPVPMLDAIRAELSDGLTVMVLTTCGYMLTPLVQALRSEGLPFHNPYRAGYHPWNPLLGARRLLAYLRPEVPVWGAENRMWTWDDMHDWTEPLQAKETLAHGAKATIDRMCARGRFGPADTRAHEQVTVDQLMKLMKDGDALASAFACDIGWWERNLRHKQRKAQSFGLTVARRHGGARLRETPRLVVGTIHSVKGGEADSVYLFPDLSATGYWDGYKVTGEPHDAVLRQIYVGMTRAKERLTLCARSSNEAVTW